MFKFVIGTTLIAIGFAGCSTSTQTPSVADSIRKSLEQNGIKDVSVKQDRDKGVVTLGGNVLTEAEKARANQIAQSLAAGQVIANEVAILPQSNSGPTKTVYADLDKGIDSNLDAALISGGYNTGIRHSVKNGVVTLTGTVDTEAQRSRIQAIAGSVPNAQQVVNEIQTRHQKATSSK